MIKLRYLLLYNWKSFLSAVVIFGFVWYFWSLYSSLQHLHDKFNRGLEQNVIKIEKAHTAKSLFKLNDILKNLKMDEIDLITITFEKADDQIFKTLHVGTIATDDIFTRIYSVDVELNGFLLGKISYKVDLAKVMLNNFFNNSLIYFLLALLAVVLLIQSNRKFIVALHVFEQRLKDAQVAIDQEDEEALSKIMEASKEMKNDFLDIYSQSLVKFLKKDGKLKETQVKADYGMNLAHDIKSDLISIQHSFQSANERPLTDSEICSINAGINHLLAYSAMLLSGKEKSTIGTNERSILLIDTLLENVVASKKAEFKGKSVTINKNTNALSFGTYVNANETELQSVLSNLINNGVEASLLDNCVIDISVQREANSLKLTISDYGTGITSDIIDKVCDRGFTTKESGNGIGLSNAISSVKSWGGTLKINSTTGKGTTIEICLPVEKTPQLLPRFIDLEGYKKIIVVDDSEAFHYVWDKKFDGKIEVQHFFDAQSVIDWAKMENDIQNILFLVDYNLDDKLNGLDVIAELGVEADSILVTSLHREAKIKKRCEENNIYLLPKEIVSEIPIRDQIAITNCQQYVLIDDDDYIRFDWENRAKKNNIELLAFASFKEFRLHKDKVNKDSLIFIDSFLKRDDRRGESIAKDLFDIDGFKNIYLVTGLDKSSFDEMYWVKNIRKKDFPDIC